MSNDNTEAFVGELRYSRDMRLFRATTLGLGTGLGAGVFLLLGPVAAWTGAREPLVYLLIGLLFLPVALSLAELAAASRPGGIYQLIEVSEHQLLSYLFGWSLLGGGVVLCGLLARGSASYLGSLFDNFFGQTLDTRWLGLIILLLLTGNNFLGSRENRWWQNAIVVGGLITLLVLSGWAWFGIPPGQATSDRPLALSVTAAVALLSSSLWGFVQILVAGDEMHHMRRDTSRALLVSLGVMSIGGALVSAAVLRAPDSLAAQPLPLAGLAMYLGGDVAQGWLLVIGLVVLTATLNRTLLALARIAVDMSRQGFLPRAWRAIHPQFHTPFKLLTGAGVLAALVSLYPDPILLAALVGLSFLTATALVNVPTILSQADRLPEKRPIVLPFSPLIPSLAVAINFFLVTTLPVKALLTGMAWFLVGGLTYILYSRHGAALARTGVTVFREERAVRDKAKYRVLVPIANPATAEALIGAGSLLAQVRGGEVLALQVVVVPEQTGLLAGQRTARHRWSLLDQTVHRAEAAGLTIHPIVRIAHSAVEGILDTAHEEGCDLILMGWRGETTSNTFDLSPIIDEVVIQAPCDVAVLKGDLPERLEHILVPTAGGPHAPAAVQIGLDLAAESQAEVVVLNLIRGPVTAAARRDAQARIDQTLAEIEQATRVGRRIARADDVKQGILEAAAGCDLLLLGASEEGLLDQITFGGLPEDIARASPRPVILVKRYRGLSQFWLRRAWRSLYALFPSLDRSEQIEVYRTMRRGARLDVDFFVLIILSSVIATLGLLQNSAAVIIGAMLVAPLMTPILAMSLGVVQGDVRLLRLALESALKGIALAVSVALGMVLLTPNPQLSPEMVARTHPTLLDLIVALASGAAGAYAIGRKEVAAALPGVAIAAALVPPLCVIGSGIALNRPEVAGGALLLFITNLIAISMAGAIVFLLLGFRPTPDERERRRRFRQGLAVSLALLLVISIPLGFFLVKTVRDGQRQQAVTRVLVREAPNVGATLVDSTIQREGGGFRVVATYYASQLPDRSTVRRIQEALSRAIGAPVRLEVVVIPVARVPAE
ncbi:MAG: hypothetical protein Kow0063_22040 [Anaerolineae bacterium]